MAVDKIPQRLVWAVEILAVMPNDQILEIGCGYGVAVALVCEKLVSGHIAAIDRSPIMFEKTSARNREHIDSGRAAVQTTALSTMNFGGQRFNKVFAVNVNLFWTRPACELRLIRDVLTTEGEMYLFYQPPTAAMARETAERVGQNLRDHGFFVRREVLADLKGETAMCLVSTPEPQ
jgi:SAM-dependent methyltransferase